MTKTTAKPAKKLAAKPAAKTTAKSAAKTTAKPATKPAAKPTAKAAAKKTSPKASVAAKPPAKPPAAKKSAVEWERFFSPLDDRVLVVRDVASERTAGGLYIPDTAADSSKPTRGLVVAVGRGHQNKKGRLQPLDVRVNDRVLFDAFAGSELELSGQKIVILREKDVLGVVKA